MLTTRPKFALLAGFQALAGLAILPYLVTDQHPNNLWVGICSVAWLLLAACNWLFASRLPSHAFEVSLYRSDATRGLLTC